MEPHEYLTIVEPGHAQTRVLGSRFLGSALTVASLEEIAATLEQKKKQYHDATHWCYAVRVGLESEATEKSSDAGEPHGTAGLPILREIRKRELSNTLVIVTRYFGGTKLGTGNLARAYGECAGLALDAARTELKQILKTLIVRCPHDDQGSVYAVAHRFHMAAIPNPQPDYAEFIFRMTPDLIKPMIESLMEAGNGRISVTEKPS
ncbi:MAG: IMPACT family protein [Calditrichota bacterium]